MLWLELLHPFVALKNLYVSKKFVPHIAPTLQDLVGGRSTEVLPTLENIFLEGFQPLGPVTAASDETLELYCRLANGLDFDRQSQGPLS
jgi:hypothetical protein